LKHPALDIPYEGAKAYCEWLTVQYNAQEKRRYKKVIFRLPTMAEWKVAALGYKDFQSWTFEENTVLAHEQQNKKETRSYKMSEQEVSYPWALWDWQRRNSITNKHTCYLANVGAPEEITCPAGIKGDGWTLTSPVGTYFANGMGLFDVVGNLAEMIDEEGKAMGGSWRQPPEECTIHSVLDYEGSDTRVGARPFMEVIEQ
ncbi:MAG: SUMF1/EgtB/PvdO family nonheme iron enzyme, partial [Bacteroidota bacterium]